MIAMRKYNLMWLLPSLLSFAIGCGEQYPTSKLIGEHDLFWQLAFADRAITLSTYAPYDTIQLHAIPRNAAGEVLDGTSQAIYTVRDSSVLVSPTGFLTARYPAKNVKVIATVSYGGITMKDTATINIVADPHPPKFMDFSVYLKAGDSAKIAMRLQSIFLVPQKQLYTSAVDSAGDSMPNIAVAFTSSDSTVATVDRNTGKVAAKRIGNVTIYATATVYGIRKTDSLQLAVTDPLLSIIYIGQNISVSDLSAHPYFSPGETTIGVGGLVFFLTSIDTDVDVIFDDPATIIDITGQEGGNIAPFHSLSSEGTVRPRMFTRAGTYPYHCSCGAIGTIVVR